MANLDELREDLEKYKAKQKLVEKLVSSPAWKMLDGELIALTRALRQQDFGTEVRSQDAAFEVTAIRGKIEGVRLARAYPEMILNDLNADLEEVRSAIEQAQRDNEEANE